MKKYFEYCPAITGGGVILVLVSRLFDSKQSVDYVMGAALLLLFFGGFIAVINFIVNKENKDSWISTMLAMLLFFLGLGLFVAGGFGGV